MFEFNCDRCKSDGVSDDFKYGLLCPKCKEGYFTFKDKQCNKCKAEISYKEYKDIDKKIDEIYERTKNVSKLVIK